MLPAPCGELGTTLPGVFVCTLFSSTKMTFSKSVMDGGRDPFAQVRDAKDFLKVSYYKQDSAGEDSVLS